MKIKRLLLCLILIGTASCFNQSPIKTKKSNRYDSKFSYQSKECSKIDLHRDVFKRDNLLGIFDCLGWNEQYPRIKNFLSTFDENQFDSFTRHYNKKFFSNKLTEERYFNLLREVNNKKIIAQANKLVQILTRTHLINLFSDFMNQTEDVGWLVNDLFLEVLPLYLEYKAKIGNTEKLKEYSKIFESENMQAALEGMTTELTYGLAKSNSRTKILKFVSDKSWPESYVHALNGDDIFKLNESFIHDFNLLKEDVNNLINFAENQDTNLCEVGGQKIFVNHILEFHDSSKSIMMLPPSEVLFDLSELVEKFSLYKNICYETQSNREYIHSSEEILKKSLELLLVKGSLEFLKKIMEINITEDPASVLDFFKVFVGDFFSSYQLFASEISISEKATLYSDILKILKKLNSQDFEKIGGLFAKLGEGVESRPATLEFILQNNKELMIDLYTDLMINELDFNGSVKPYLELVNFLPETSEDKEFIVQFFMKMVEANKDEAFRKELVSFLSSESVYQFTSLVGRSKKTKKRMSISTPVKVQQLAYELFTSKCTHLLREIKDINFESLVESKIFECAQNTPNYFFYNIYKWTADVNEIFEDQFSHKFSVNYGVVSPVMMGFYVNLFLAVNENLYAPDRDYIREAIYDIKNVLVDKGFLATLNSSINIVNDVNKKLNLTDPIMQNLLSANNRNELDNFKIRNLMTRILSDDKSPMVSRAICEDLNSNISNLNCLTKGQFTQYLEEVADLLIRKNRKGENTLKHVLDMLYGEGFTIPVATSNSREYTLKFSELLNFFNHVSSEETIKEITINNAKSFEKINLNLSQRLEVLIREIGFNSNFYGIYFINVASKAINYTRELNMLRSQLRLMVGSSSIFRRFRVFNPESRWKFRNVWNTYQALLDLEGPFDNNSGKDHSYASLIQGLMGATVKASENQSVNFHPYRAPKVSLVIDHRGHLIRKLSELSFITRMGLLLKRIDSKMSLERTDRLDRLWENFTQKIPKTVLENFLNKVLASNNLNQISQDIFEIQEKFEPTEVDNIINIASGFLEDYLEYSKNPDQIFKILEFFVDNYTAIKNNFNGFFDLNGIISAKKLESIFNESWVRKLIIQISDDVLKNREKLESFLLDEKLSSDIVYNLKTISDINFKLDTKKLKKVLTDNRIDWMAIIYMLENINNSELGVDYLNNILEVMSQKNNSGKPRIEAAIDEIFKDTESLETFLRNVFNKVQFTQ